MAGDLASLLRMRRDVSREDLPVDKNGLAIGPVAVHESCMFSYARLEYLMALAESGVPSDVLVRLNNDIVAAWIGPVP